MALRQPTLLGVWRPTTGENAYSRLERFRAWPLPVAWATAVGEPALQRRLQLAIFCARRSSGSDAGHLHMFKKKRTAPAVRHEDKHTTLLALRRCAPPVQHCKCSVQTS